MVKVRLMRIGTKKRPFYRVVAVDERKKRTGSYIENLGTYNPLTEPKEIILKQDRIDDWVKKGACLSNGFLRIIGKAPQRPPRKPKKEAKTPESAAPVAQAPAETLTPPTKEIQGNTAENQAVDQPAPAKSESEDQNPDTPSADAPSDSEQPGTSENEENAGE